MLSRAWGHGMSFCITTGSLLAVMMLGEPKSSGVANSSDYDRAIGFLDRLLRLPCRPSPPALSGDD